MSFVVGGVELAMLQSDHVRLRRSFVNNAAYRRDAAIETKNHTTHEYRSLSYVRTVRGLSDITILTIVCATAVKLKSKLKPNNKSKIGKIEVFQFSLLECKMLRFQKLHITFFVSIIVCPMQYIA